MSGVGEDAEEAVVRAAVHDALENGILKSWDTIYEEHSARMIAVGNAMFDPVERALAAREESVQSLSDQRKALDDAITNYHVAVVRHEKASRAYLEALDAQKDG